MKLISNMICALLLVTIVLGSSGCCALSGAGMKIKQEERIANQDAFHKKMCDAMKGFGS